MTEGQQTRIARPRTLLVATIVVAVAAVTMNAVVDVPIGPQAPPELAAEANATYGGGNWTYSPVECGQACVFAPEPVNASVPNASVEVGPTEAEVSGWDTGIPLPLLAALGAVVGAAALLGGESA